MTQSVPPGKNTALVAYAPFVGFLIAFFINKDENHPFATWHIKNMFGLFLMFVIALVFQNGINYVLGDIIWIFTFICWLYSFVMAYRNKERGIPGLSGWFQQWFRFLD